MEEFDLPRQVVARRCYHRYQHDRRFLALKSIDRADPITLGQAGPL
jgi:hypothetical protein